jgi:hypothetical protein
MGARVWHKPMPNACALSVLVKLASQVVLSPTDFISIAEQQLLGLYNSPQLSQTFTHTTMTT